MPKISVIIPVFNNAAFLPQCLDSLLSQSFQDFEVILVDDGSSDGSAAICDDYQKKDNRLKVYHIQNHGVSYARNYGLELANGEWISFVDSDDWVELDYLNTLYNETDSSIDIVIANLYLNNGKKQIKKRCSRKEIRKKDFPLFPLSVLVPDSAKVDGLNVSLELLSSACNKLTRKSLLDTYHIRFKEGMSLNEDGMFHLMCYLKARDFKIIETPLYHYRILANSSNRRYMPNVHNQNMIIDKAFYDLSEEIPGNIARDFYSLISYRLYLNLMTLYIDHSMNDQSLICKMRLLKKYLDTDLYHIYSVPYYMTFFKKVELMALKHHYCFVLILLSKIRSCKNVLY